MSSPHLVDSLFVATSPSPPPSSSFFPNHFTSFHPQPPQSTFVPPPLSRPYPFLFPRPWSRTILALAYRSIYRFRLSVRFLPRGSHVLLSPSGPLFSGMAYHGRGIFPIESKLPANVLRSHSMAGQTGPQFPSKLHRQRRSGLAN